MPETVLDLLKKNLSTKCVKTDSKQITHVILEEKDKQAKLKKLTIEDLDDDVLVLDTDSARDICGKKCKYRACNSPLFSNEVGHGLNRACDAVLVRKIKSPEDSFEVCYIELKSDMPKPEDYRDQFKSTTCFMKYLSLLTNEICKTKFVIRKEHYVVFHTDPEGGSRSKIKNTKLNKNLPGSSPDNPQKKAVKNGDKISINRFFRATTAS